MRAGTDNPRLISSIEKKIRRHIPHPKYNGTFYFDVALIILEEVSFFKDTSTMRFDIQEWKEWPKTILRKENERQILNCKIFIGT